MSIAKGRRQKAELEVLPPKGSSDPPRSNLTAIGYISHSSHLEVSQLQQRGYSILFGHSRRFHTSGI